MNLKEFQKSVTATNTFHFLQDYSKSRVETKAPKDFWEEHYYCSGKLFKTKSEFAEHLQICNATHENHCQLLQTKNPTDLIGKHSGNKEFVSETPEWSRCLGAQNLATVLNDPTCKKCSNIFTKKWGCSFVENVVIADSPYIPKISWLDFEEYLAEIKNRYNKQTKDDAIQFSHLNKTPLTHEACLYIMPEIFYEEHFMLENLTTFTNVFPNLMLTNCERDQHYRTLLQEQLSHYLDIIENKIVQQVSLKSADFFQVMSTQYTNMCKMQDTISTIQKLRDTLRAVEISVVGDSLQIIRAVQRKKNYQIILNKLKLMSTVHKTRSTLQLFLKARNYVSALELITLTQQILSKEFTGMHCFKHLPMEFAELDNFITSMLHSEFQRVIKISFTRLLSDGLKQNSYTDEAVDHNELLQIIMGLLYKRNFNFVNIYNDKAVDAIHKLIKQFVYEVIATGNREMSLDGTSKDLHLIPVADWIALLKKTTDTLVFMLKRINVDIGIMRLATSAAAGKATEVNILLETESYLAATEYAFMQNELIYTMNTICNYCQERCAYLIYLHSTDPRITAISETDIQEVIVITDEFSAACAEMCDSLTLTLKVAVKTQASRFAKAFHSIRKQNLTHYLDLEQWRQVYIPVDIQQAIERIFSNDFSLAIQPLSNLSTVFNRDLNSHNLATQSCLTIKAEGRCFSVPSVVLHLIQMLTEYCCYAVNLKIVANNLMRDMLDLVRVYNSRCCQLIIGAGAIRLVGLKTITGSNLALAASSLQLILFLLPKIKAHFTSIGLCTTSSYDAIVKDLESHIAEIESKICTIVIEKIGEELEAWIAKPPVPSNSLRNISLYLVKLHEAISPILTEAQLHNIFIVVNHSFQQKLKDKLIELKVVNNGGPQHGIVTSELTFYVETLRGLKVLQQSESNYNIIENIWNFKK